MIKNIIREVAPESCDFSFYFDNDGMRDYDGNHFNYNLFIIQHGYYGRIDGGLNLKDYKRTQERAEAIIDGFNEVEEGFTTYDGDTITYEMIMDDENITHDKRDALIAWYNADPDTNHTEDIAEFLTITTGEKWISISSRGYCQGDYVEIVYSESHYTESDAINAGEIYLGAAKEFCVVNLDENGEETDTCYGFIIADNQIKGWTDADSEYKRIICEYDGLNPDETRIELIDYNAPIITRTIYSYKTIDPEPIAALQKAAHTTTATKGR